MSNSNEINKSLVKMENELEKLKPVSVIIKDLKNSAEETLNKAKKLLEQSASQHRSKSAEVINSAKEAINVTKSASAAIIKDSRNSAEETLNKAKQLYEQSASQHRSKSAEVINSAKEAINVTKSASTTIIRDSQNLCKSLNNLVGACEKLLEGIKNINFPDRLDKLDTTVSTINLSIQKLDGRQETIANETKVVLKELNESFTTETKNMKTSIMGSLEILNTGVNNAESKTQDVLSAVEEAETKTGEKVNKTREGLEAKVAHLESKISKGNKINTVLLITVLLALIALGSFLCHKHGLF